MNIPDKALEAAVQALFEDGCGEPKVDAATMLEAAAPFIAAQALRDASDALDSWHSESLDGGPWDSGFLHASDMVRDRADELDQH